MEVKAQRATTQSHTAVTSSSSSSLWCEFPKLQPGGEGGRTDGGRGGKERVGLVRLLLLLLLPPFHPVPLFLHCLRCTLEEEEEGVRALLPPIPIFSSESASKERFGGTRKGGGTTRGERKWRRNRFRLHKCTYNPAVQIRICTYAKIEEAGSALTLQYEVFHKKHTCAEN